MNEAGKVLFQQSVVTLALRLLAQSALTELAKVKRAQAEAWLDESEAQVIHGVKGFVPTPNVPDDVFQEAVEMALAQVRAAFGGARRSARPPDRCAGRAEFFRRLRSIPRVVA